MAQESRYETLQGVTVGEFRGIELIGEGAIGRTYRGEHVLTGVPVCLKHCKMISDEHARIMIEEARILFGIRHYELPAVHNLLKLDDGSLVLVMSYIKGTTIAKMVEKHGALDPEIVAGITERILNALKFLHFKRVAHGDVKPQNVIVQKEHIVALVDFGLALAKPTAESRARGYTDHFAAPEAISRTRGSGINAFKSDLYSLGMTMIFMLGGGMDCVLRKEIPPTTPEPLAQFLKRLIVRDPSSRPWWGEEDLCETIQKVRLKAFDRTHSEMKEWPL